MTRLFLAGLGGLLLGMLLDNTIWPDKLFGLMDLPWKPTWTICPIVKKIWTPTWVIFSAGWCFLFLSFFYCIVDVINWKWWTYPLVVLGTNSIAIYVLSQVLGDWAKTAIRGTAGMTLGVGVAGAPPDMATTVSKNFSWQMATLPEKVAFACFSDFPGQMVRAFLVFIIFWCLLAMMYRKKVFVRI